jgi:hypothetical protein
MTRYFAPISAAGTFRCGQLPGSIVGLEALDKPMPIGMASVIGRTKGGLAVRRLTSTGTTPRAEGHPRPAVCGGRWRSGLNPPRIMPGAAGASVDG